MKTKFQMKSATVGFLTAVVALLLLVALCVGVYHISADYTLFSTSGNPMGEISKDALTFTQSLDEDVTVYWLCPDGQADESLASFLIPYLEANEHIHLKNINTTEHPDFAQKYTSTPLSDYSLIVETGRRYRVIDCLEMYYYTNEYINSYLGSEYRIPVTQYESLRETFGTYMDQAKTCYYFNGEACLVSALDYVTVDRIPRPYVMTGHGEGIKSELLKTIMNNAGLSPEPLDLEKAEKAPDDANCIILFSPTTDLSAHEAELLKAHIKGGGSFLLVAGPDTADYENLASVTALFGMGSSGGIVLEGNTQYYKSDRSYLLPLINSNHSAMYAIGSMGYLAFMPESMAIIIDSELPSNVKTTAMLGTSDSGYRASKDSARTPLCKPAAQFVAASAVLETTTVDGIADNAYFAWFASDLAFTDEVLKNTTYGNYYYLAMTAKWMTEDEAFASEYESLAADDLSVALLEDMTPSVATVLCVVTVAILPLGLLVTGLAIWLKRRNR